MSAERPTVAEATEEDVEAIAAFFWAAWREAGPDAPGFAGASDEVLKQFTAREALLERLGGPDRRMFLAKEGPEVVGFSANRRLDGEEVELAGIVVLQRMRGQGVGSQLLDAALRAARQDGYRYMLVRTEADNERAKAFYQAKGFEFVRSLTEEVEGVTVDLWELGRQL